MGIYVVDHFGDQLCMSCTSGDPCLSCQRATSRHGDRMSVTLRDGRVSCVRCHRGAVLDEDGLARAVPPVRGLLQSYGIRLPNRVAVQLGEPRLVASRGGPHSLGYTTTRRGFHPEVLEIRVVDGLTATLFGAVLAHEIGHAWLSGCPGDRSSVEEEGICELLASWWLADRGGRLAAFLLDSMARRPDDVYGTGYRWAMAQADGLSPWEVVDGLSKRGSIRRRG